MEGGGKICPKQIFVCVFMGIVVVGLLAYFIPAGF